MLGQTFSPGDLATIAILVMLEGVLSLDNALVLATLSLRVEESKRMRALSYGLIGALVIRVIAVGLAAYLLRWSIIQLIGGVYLLWVAIKYFAGVHHKPGVSNSLPKNTGFWQTVLAIELTDITFAI